VGKGSGAGGLSLPERPRPLASASAESGDEGSGRGVAKRSISSSEIPLGNNPPYSKSDGGSFSPHSLASTASKMHFTMDLFMWFVGCEERVVAVSRLINTNFT